ncbi:MAG TPA: peptidoglycan DD-metalloendopeptidase family protein [Chitinophagaceae bacterium]|nr:peptidoglycan DD-metalloendopeptidase family protein [Chitinophagaceae bacterium]
MTSQQLILVLQKNREMFYPVVPFDPSKDKLLSLDFTISNKELTDDVLLHPDQFIRYINDKLNDAGARYGIGGYAEHRTVYSKSSVFDGNNPGDEPRRLHLGVDIWGKPHTAVIAPLDGIVHSFGFNNRPGDYGATIILTHTLDGLSFYTLYGHLSLNSIKNLSEGERIKGGDIFAEFGIPAENGGWPSHLHFQIILDMDGWNGDYPGVCKYSEREKWLANSPDGDLILRLSGNKSHFI